MAQVTTARILPPKVQMHIMSYLDHEDCLALIHKTGRYTGTTVLVADAQQYETFYDSLVARTPRLAQQVLVWMFLQV
ncbi:hypothetical protein UA08_06846 [Talaromyces atroroseus]|uniref:F-box domain-containing protein n=1 Tax=Talaromyces atroroseus TaxID=1441469 RepID=A0A225AFV0_TALAT|nr:hypothetical protein UA08_06846 [Talaromyces atroroseus]OKL58023.1 hypothetical protein UA08_06846 [Talaromyces atroroseus]